MSTPRWVYTLQRAQKYNAPLERKDDNKLINQARHPLVAWPAKSAFREKFLKILFFQKIVGLLNIIKQSDEFSNNSFIKEYWLKS